MPRNRAEEAKRNGGRMLAVPLTAEGVDCLATVQEGLTVSLGRCSQAQAVEWALREAAKKIRKKIANGLDKD